MKFPEVISQASDGQPRRKRVRAAYALGVILVLVVGIFIGRYLVPAADLAPTSPLRFVKVNEGGEREITFPTFWEAWDKLHAKYIDADKLTAEQLFYGAVGGMVRSTGDPYTVFADPKATKQFEETLEGTFFGVGIEIGIRSGLITVIAPLSGSPAEKAGIREGDILVAINKEALSQDSTLDDVVSRIRGPRGSKVTLTVIRKDSKEPQEIEVERQRIEIESVKMEITDGIAHLTITNFNADTASRFTTLARQATQQNVRGILLDVRNNPGGFLDSAVQIASRFVPEDTLVVTERGKNTTEYKAKGSSLLTGLPVVVLVNSGSASASEILAGALKDILNAPLVGTKTFGKGSVQEIVKLSDGSSMRVTIAKWFTPSGHNIAEEGIEPTIEVEQNTETDEDEQLIRAREELTKRLSE